MAGTFCYNAETKNKRGLRMKQPDQTHEPVHSQDRERSLPETEVQALLSQFWRLVGKLATPVLAGALLVSGCGDDSVNANDGDTNAVADTQELSDTEDTTVDTKKEPDSEPVAVDGRPFVVDGAVRHSRMAPGEGWSHAQAIPLDNLGPEEREVLHAHWARIAQGEHASIASFSRFTLELLHLGATENLLMQCAEALRDEVRHARIALSMAATYAGQPVAPSPLDIRDSLNTSREAAHILRSTIQGGCINETLAIAQIKAAASRTRIPAIQELLRDIAEDESRHAALAWQSARWMIEERPSLRAVAEQTFEEHRLTAPSQREDVRPNLEAHGYLTPHQAYAAVRHAMTSVVTPCMETLLS